MRKMVTSDLIVQAMNATAAESVIVEEIPEAGKVVIRQPAKTVTAEQAEAEEEKNPESDLTESPPVDDEIEVEENAEEATAAEEVEAGVEDRAVESDLTVTTRSGRSVNKPLRYMQVTKVSKEDWKTEASTKAIELELKMLFAELKALRCVKRAAIKARTKILKSHMFVVEKYLANGNFDKMKARLVADGRDQDAEMYPDKSSPTVAVHSVFTALHCKPKLPILHVFTPIWCSLGSAHWGLWKCCLLHFGVSIISRD